MTILLVDGDPDFRQALAENLRDDGYEVVAFEAPPPAPELGRLGGVDLLVTDFHLPHTSGIAFAEAFHRAFPAGRVVLVTADPSPEIAAAAGARPYLTFRNKPIAYADLRSAIRSVAGRQ